MKIRDTLDEILPDLKSNGFALKRVLEPNGKSLDAILTYDSKKSIVRIPKMRDTANFKIFYIMFKADKKFKPILPYSEYFGSPREFDLYYKESCLTDEVRNSLNEIGRRTISPQEVRNSEISLYKKFNPWEYWGSKPYRHLKPGSNEYANITLGWHFQKHSPHYSRCIEAIDPDKFNENHFPHHIDQTKEERHYCRIPNGEPIPLFSFDINLTKSFKLKIDTGDMEPSRLSQLLDQLPVTLSSVFYYDGIRVLEYPRKYLLVIGIVENFENDFSGLSNEFKVYHNTSNLKQGVSEFLNIYHQFRG